MRKKLGLFVLIFGVLSFVCIRPNFAQDSTATVFMKLKPSLAIVLNSQGVGTGFCISSSDSASYYLTNEHVVGTDKTVTVFRQYPTVQKMTGTVIARGIDGSPDLAVVKVPIPRIRPVQLITGSLHEGDPIADAGYPVAQYDLSKITGSIVPSIHTGTISALENRGGVVEYDAQTLPGNSGGPLFDPRTGAVGAVVQAKLVGTTEANLGIGIARVVIPFLQQHSIAYHEYSGSVDDATVAAAPRAPTDDEALLKAAPGAETAAIIYDTSRATGAVSAPGIANAALDFATKFRTRFGVRTVLVDQHIATKDDCAQVLSANGALIGVTYSTAFRNTSAYTNAFGTSSKWEFSLGAGLFDRYEVAWGGFPPISKNVSSNRSDFQNIIESSFADLNDQAIEKLAAILPDPDVAINFFKYGFPLKTGAKRAFFNVLIGSAGARARVVGDFSPAAQAGLQNDDLVLQINGTATNGMSQDQVEALLKSINDAGGAFDLTIRTADGKETHIKFESQTLRWYVDHRPDASGSS